MMLAVALAYVFLGVETHGRAMALGPGQSPARTRPRVLETETR